MKMSLFQARILSEKIYYENVSINPDTIKCKFCVNTYSKSEIFRFIKHLNDNHDINELTDHPDRAFLLQNFDIDVDRRQGLCKICVNIIDYDEREIYILKNHFEIYHGNNAHIYNTAIKAKNGRDILNNFILIGSEATCLKCELKIDISNLNMLTAQTLEEMVQHFFSHDRLTFREDFQKDYLKELAEQLHKEELKELDKIKLKYQWSFRRMEESVLNEPGPSTSSSTAADRTERSEQSEDQNIPTKKSKSSTLDETVKQKLKQKKKE